MEEANPSAAMLAIGDELLSGRTRDSNLHHLAGALSAAGIALREARIVADDTGAIVHALRALRRRHRHVFTSGGIGPTHDDITAEAVAQALGVPLLIDPQARARLVAYYAATGARLNAARLRMARIPLGARLIDNPVSAAPGFSLRGVHVLAGVPEVFRAMLAGLLPELAHGRPLTVRSLTVPRPEGEIAAPLAALAAAFPALAIGCYPFEREGRFGATVVLRGAEPAAVEAALAELRRAFPEASG